MQRPCDPSHTAPAPGPILVTGASGQVGGAAVRALLPRGAPVRALVRDPQTTSGLGGAELARGSFEDGAALARAMRGVHVMLLAGRDNPEQVDQHRRVLSAAAQAGVAHVVKLSAIGAAPSSPVELMRHHAIVEEELRAGPLAWTVVRPHLFMQNLLRSAEALRSTGLLRAPMGSMRVPLVDTRDVGEAVAEILASARVHAGMVYELTGPAALGYDDVAAFLADAIGRPIAYVAQAPDDYERELLTAGLPPWRAADLARIASAYADEDLVPTPDLERLLGHIPHSLTDFLADHGPQLAGTSRG